MDFDKPLLPFVKKIPYESLAENLIGIRPDEKWDDAVRRHLLEQRVKKINKIRNNIKSQKKKGRY